MFRRPGREERPPYAFNPRGSVQILSCLAYLVRRRRHNTNTTIERGDQLTLASLGALEEATAWLGRHTSPVEAFPAKAVLDCADYDALPVDVLAGALSATAEYVREVHQVLEAQGRWEQVGEDREGRP
jgi:hypothetical protein